MDLLNATLKELGKPHGVSRFVYNFRFFKVETQFWAAGLPAMDTTHLLTVDPQMKQPKLSFYNRSKYRANI